MVRKLSYPGFGPFCICEYTVYAFEICLLILFKPDYCLFCKLDPALRLLDICNHFQIIRTALLIEKLINISEICLKIGEFVLLYAPIGIDTGDLYILLLCRCKKSVSFLLFAMKLSGGTATLKETDLFAISGIPARVRVLF